MRRDLINCIAFVVGVFLGWHIGDALAKEVATVQVQGVPSAVRQTDVIEQWKKSVHVVDGAVSQGSAVVFKKGKAISAWHVFENQPEGVKILDKGEWRTSKISWKSEADDLVIFDADVDCPCANIGDVVVGSRAVAVGFPMRKSMYMLQYWFSGDIVGFADEGRLIVSTASVMPGMSGGGLFQKDSDGTVRLVGILVGMPIAPLREGFGSLTSVSKTLPKEAMQ